MALLSESSSRRPIQVADRWAERYKAPYQGVRLTIMRMRQRDAFGMVQYYWSAITGTDRSISFARMMQEEGFTHFEETIEEFRDRFCVLW